MPVELPGEITLDHVMQALAYHDRNRILRYYPEAGPLRRELYAKHMQFFAAGGPHERSVACPKSCHGEGHKERACIAGNRVGKTEGIGAFEATLHLTGRYPAWWKGKRFTHPIKAWVAGDTNQTTRDVLQAKLLGQITRQKGDDPSQPIGLGTGMIPADTIRHTRPKSHLPNAIETAWIRHASGGTSVLVFKSYEQGRKAFQGTEQDLIWADEEPPEDVYMECLMRTMRTATFAGGVVLLTFTPLSGWSTVVTRFLAEAEREESGRFVVQAGWDDAPHLSEAEKAEMLAKLPPHQRDARSKGIPQLGAGAIYPVEESRILVDPVAIPSHWARAYALDVGWNRTACLWGAWDRDADVRYLYAELYQAHSEPSDVARAIRAKGEWIPGVIDPAARGRSQADGQQLIRIYRDLGLDIEPAQNAREAGIETVLNDLTDGRLKAFRTLENWKSEYRMYRRDDKGRVVKENDHLMDSTRYLEMSGFSRAKTQPVKRPPQTRYVPPSGGSGNAGWMA